MSTPVRSISLTDQEVGFYRDQGYLLIPNVVDTAAVDGLKDEVMEIVRHGGQTAAKLRQVSQTYLAGSGLDRLINSDRITQLASGLMDGESHLHSVFTAVKSPGGGRFHFHQYTQFDGPGINRWFALCPMSPANGCIEVVPKSHTNGTLPSVNSGDGDHYLKIETEPSDPQPIAMNPGDVLAFSRLAVHGSGANTTQSPRVGFAIQCFRHDVQALIDGQWLALLEQPRFDLTPKSQLGGDGPELLDQN